MESTRCCAIEDLFEERKGKIKGGAILRYCKLLEKRCGKHKRTHAAHALVRKGRIECLAVVGDLSGATAVGVAVGGFTHHAYSESALYVRTMKL